MQRVRHSLLRRYIYSYTNKCDDSALAYVVQRPNTHTTHCPEVQQQWSSPSHPAPPKTRPTTSAAAKMIFRSRRHPSHQGSKRKSHAESHRQPRHALQKCHQLLAVQPARGRLQLPVQSRTKGMNRMKRFGKSLDKRKVDYI